MKGTRAIAALGIAAVVWGWGVAQYPVLLPRTALTLSNAGAPSATMAALVVLFIAAVLLIGPSFALLFRLQRRRLLAGEPGTLQPAAPAGRALPPRAPPGQSLPTGQSPAVRAAVLTLVTVAALVRRRRQS